MGIKGVQNPDKSNCHSLYVLSLNVAGFQRWNRRLRVRQVRGHEVRHQKVGRHQVQVARGSDLRAHLRFYKWNLLYLIILFF